MRAMFVIICGMISLAATALAELPEPITFTDAPATLVRQAWSLNGAWSLLPVNANVGQKALTQPQDFKESLVVQVPGYWDQDSGLANLLGPVDPKRWPLPDWDGAVWYGKRFKFNIAPKDRCFRLRFEGVSAQAEVFLNGVSLGSHQGGYTPFVLAIPANAIKTDAENFLAVKVTDMAVCAAQQPPAALPGVNSDRGGIWGSVTLISTGRIFITKVVPQTSAQELDLRLETQTNGPGNTPDGLRARVELKQRDTGAFLTEPWEETLAGSPPFSLKINKLNPELWTLDHPQLYALTLTLLAGGQASDAVTRSIGFRTVRVTEGKMFLNNRPVYLLGANVWLPLFERQDRALAGKYLGLLKAAGVNAVRFPYEPPAELWLEETDRLGMLAVVSPPLHGMMLKEEYCRNENFCRQAQAEMEETVSGLGHHPSVVIWSIGSELGAINSGHENKYALLHRLVEHLRKLDSWRPVLAEVESAQGTIALGDFQTVARMDGWYGDSSVCNLENLAKLARPNHAIGGAAPLLVTECVGAYLACDRDEFLPELPQRTAGWRAIGKDSVACAPGAYRAWLTREAAGMLRRMRGADSRLAGQFLQTADFYLWDLRDCAKVRPRQPGYDALRQAYAPVAVVFDNEMRHLLIRPGSFVRLHVCNDGVGGEPLANCTARVLVNNASGSQVAASMAGWKVPPIPTGDHAALEIPVPLPADLPKGTYMLVGEVYQGNLTIATTEAEFVIAPSVWAKAALPAGLSVAWYGQDRRMSAALSALGISAGSPEAGVPVFQQVALVDEGYLTHAKRSELERLRQWVQTGGSAVVYSNGDVHPYAWLSQEFAWETLESFNIPFTEMLAVPGEGVFNGLERSDLRAWNNANNLVACAAMSPSYAPAVRILAAAYRWNQTETWPVLSLVQHGQGQVYATTMDFLARSQTDPVALRFLANLLAEAVRPRDTPPQVNAQLPLYRFQPGTPADRAFIGAGWSDQQRAWPIHYRQTEAASATLNLPLVANATAIVELAYAWHDPAPVTVRAGTQAVGALTKERNRVRLTLPPSSEAVPQCQLVFESPQPGLQLAGVSLWAEVDRTSMATVLKELQKTLRVRPGVNLCAQWMGTHARGGLILGEIGPENLIDGLASDYGADFGLAEAALGDPLIVEFAEPMRLDQVNVLLWDEPGKVYRFTVEGQTADGAWVKLADHASQDQHGWVEDKFPATLCQALRVVGMASPGASAIHIIEVQAFGPGK